MSNGEKKIPKVDHSKDNVLEACQITKERGDTLLGMFEPEQWLKPDNSISLTECAEEIASLPLNQATYVIAQKLNALWNVHPKIIERRNDGRVKVIMFTLTHPQEIFVVNHIEEMEHMKHPNAGADEAKQNAWRAIFRQGVMSGLINGRELQEKFELAQKTGDLSHLTLGELEAIKEHIDFIQKAGKDRYGR